ncbi:MAG: hypothetical protein JWP97_6457 [Labilithrix sp.]|nr:hypothetical protein [Labilithrix sp.]
MPTPYRSETDALRERKTSLEGELARLRGETFGLDQLRARQAELARELADVDQRLHAGASSRRGLPLLEEVKVASPCKADWNEMMGNERVRFCLSCEKNVFNLSAMARDEAEALLQSHAGGDLCVRFYQRADGTVLTQDCPVGVKSKQRKRLAFAVAGAGALVAASAAAMFGTRAQGTLQPMTGAVAYEPPIDPPVITPPLQEVVPMTMGTVAPVLPPPPVPQKHKPAKVAK